MFGAFAAGGTSTVHLGRLHGTAGFVKPIAIKRLHPHLAADPALRAILVDEARLVSRISHPNVVTVLDIVEDDGELFLVFEYVHGATLGALCASGKPCSAATVIAVMRDVLSGLHAAHHARDASGEFLGLVHRDVSPKNVIVTTGGVGKILDFGIAKARARQSITREGHVRGSLPYMAPEQLADEVLTARTDVYSAAVVLWEALTGERLFIGETEAAIIKRILDHDVRAPSTVRANLPRGLDAVVLRGLSRDPDERFASGLEMALALEGCLPPARPAEVASWVMLASSEELARRQELLDTTSLDATFTPVSSRSLSTTPLVSPPRQSRVRPAMIMIASGALFSVAAVALIGRVGAEAPARLSEIAASVDRGGPPVVDATSPAEPSSAAPEATADAAPVVVSKTYTTWS